MKIYVEEKERYPVFSLEEKLPETPGLDHYLRYYPAERTDDYSRDLLTDAISQTTMGSHTAGLPQIRRQKTAAEARQESIDFITAHTIDITEEEFEALKEAEENFNRWQNFLYKKLEEKI